VLNARDAMPKGGSVSISAENVTLKPADTKAKIEGEFVALRIADTGAGIAPDVLPRVFDPFFTTKQVDKGTGLGLSQVYGFAHQAGGTVAIESELGKGTAVTLYLPCAGANESAEAEGPAKERAGAGAVLVVEDNPDVMEVSVAMLTQLGYAVTSVTDAAAALAAVERQEFDLVMSDIVMPGGLDGLALARALRARKPDLPVLLVTGYSHQVADAAAEFVVLRKPYKLAEISRAIDRMIAESRQPASSNIVRLRNSRGGPVVRGDKP